MFNPPCSNKELVSVVSALAYCSEVLKQTAEAEKMGLSMGVCQSLTEPVVPPPCVGVITLTATRGRYVPPCRFNGIMLH